MLVLLISTMAFLAVLLLAISAASLVVPRLRARIERREQMIGRALRELFMSGVTARQVLVMTALGAVSALALVDLTTDSLVLAIGAALAIWLLPMPVFRALARRRVKRFEEQLPGSLLILSSSTKAGLSLAQALEEVAHHAVAPLREEFAQLVHDYKFAGDLAVAIRNARARLDSRSFNLVATALLVNRQKGGNLTEALDTMASSLKEVWRLEQKLITSSTEGRKAVWLISGMPIGIFLMVLMMQPELATVLTTDPIGIVMLVVAGLLYSGGIAWLLRILRVDV